MKELTGKNQFRMLDTILRASGYTTDGLKHVRNTDTLYVSYKATYTRGDKTIEIELDYHSDDCIDIFCEVLPELVEVFDNWVSKMRVRWCRADKNTINWLRSL